MMSEEEKMEESREAMSLSLQLSDDLEVVEAYNTALVRNKSRLKGKIAIEVECGCAWLSMLAVRVAELDKVFAIESNEHSAKIAAEIVKKNKLDSKGKGFFLFLNQDRG